MGNVSSAKLDGKQAISTHSSLHQNNKSVARQFVRFKKHHGLCCNKNMFSNGLSLYAFPNYIMLSSAQSEVMQVLQKKYIIDSCLMHVFNYCLIV